MRILKIHISNFGKLHELDYDFSKPLTVICEENGWGKSTLTAFLKAMFYGLQGNGKRDLENNERKRYAPWQGGAFGGSLTFEAKGKTYLLSRIFKDKEANDEFDLRDALTNLKSEDYSACIGQELFGIDCASFERTVFIGQNACMTETNGDINAKIGNVVQLANDMGAYEKAANCLEISRKEYKTDRSHAGIISRTDDRIRELRLNINSKSGLEQTLEGNKRLCDAEEEHCNSIRHRIEINTQRQREIEKNRELLHLREEWQRLCGERDEAQKRLDESEEFFANGIPEKAELEAVIRKSSELEKSRSAAENYAVTAEETGELEALSKLFTQDCPSETDISLMINKSNDLAAIRGEHARGMMTAEENARLSELNTVFSEGEKVDEIIAKWGDCERLRAEISANKSAVDMMKSVAAESKPKKKLPLLLIIGVPVLVLGLAAVLCGFKLPGLLLAAAGLIVSVPGLFVMLKGGNSSAAEQTSPEMSEAIGRITRAEEELRRAERQVADFLKGHGRSFCDNMVAEQLQQLKKDEWELAGLKERKAAERKLTSVGRVVELSGDIKKFLNRYSVNAEEKYFTDELYKLKNASGRYAQLSEKAACYREAFADCSACAAEIKGFFDKYGFAFAQNDAAANDTEYRSLLNEVYTHLQDYRFKAEAFEQTSKKVELFVSQNDTAAFASLTEVENVSAAELAEEVRKLSEELNASTKAIHDYNSRTNELLEMLDERADEEAELAELEAELKNYKKNYANLRKAEEHLKKAKENITMHYTEPIYKGFANYYAAVTAGDADDYHLDANTKLTFEAAGMQRELSTLSCGYRDLTGISMRIALVDAMYENEEPMLIMDDPFVNLDDEKASMGIKLLEKISEKYQVIYMTCSRTRA